MNEKFFKVLLYLAILGGAYYFIYKKFLNPAERNKEYLRNLGFYIVDRMSDSEVNAAATYIRDYLQKGLRPPVGSTLYYQIEAISKKYNMFT